MPGIPVQLQAVTHLYPDGTQSLNQIDLQVQAGAFLSVLGPSGCGKSTLLRLIAGLESPTQGHVKVGQTQAQDSYPPALAYVFQEAYLLPWRNTLANVALPLELRGVPKSVREDQAAQALKELGLTHVLNKYPDELSGGMKMRASIARALTLQPKLLLLDEPFASLDEMIRQKLADNLLSLWNKIGMTVIFVTHSVSEAVYLSQKLVILSTHPGKILHVKTIDLEQNRHPQMRSEIAFAQELAAVQRLLEKFDDDRGSS